MAPSDRLNLPGHTATPASPVLRVGRVYNQQPAALDELIEVLHLLLVDGVESTPVAPPEPPCFPSALE
jgi:hypothetical protein